MKNLAAMRYAVVLTGALALMAAKSVSPAFDGSYSGTLTPNAALSTGTCAPVSNYAISVSKGTVQGPALAGKGAFTALVTEDGFLTGRASINGKSYPVEGRIADRTLLAGLITDNGECVWTLKLERKA